MRLHGIRSSDKITEFGVTFAVRDVFHVVEEALCFGWVDSRPRRLDDARSQLLVTPCKPISRWSRLNKQRVERQSAAGLMMPAGLAAVEIAKQNGAWNAA